MIVTRRSMMVAIAIKCWIAGPCAISSVGDRQIDSRPLPYPVSMLAERPCSPEIGKRVRGPCRDESLSASSPTPCI